MNTLQLYLYAGLTCLFGFLLLKCIIGGAFSMNTYSTHKKRLRQLQYHSKQTIKDDELIHTVTKPIIDKIFSKISPFNVEELERNLVMVGWDKTLSPIQFRALEVIALIVGIFITIVYYFLGGGIISFVLGIGVVFLPKFLLKNEVNNVKTKYMMGFPDIIRIIQGYLSINQPFVTAVENSLKFVETKEWRDSLKEFIIVCNTQDIDSGLNWLQAKINIFEIKEFVSLIQLHLQQGGDTKKSFDEQAGRINEILQDIIAVKIEKRRVYSYMIQAPLLICCFVSFGLPLFGQMGSLGV